MQPGENKEHYLSKYMERDFDKDAESYDRKPGWVKLAQDVR